MVHTWVSRGSRILIFPDSVITLNSLNVKRLIVLFVLGSLWGLIVAALSDGQKGARYI
jgi:hypothetical protein